MKITLTISLTMLLGVGLMILPASFPERPDGEQSVATDHKRSSD
jgi:hypothetical protein